MSTIRKQLILFILILAFLLSVSGCATSTAQESEVLRAKVEMLLDALLANDSDAAYAAVYSGFDRAEFDAAFSRMRDSLPDADSYELALIQYNYTTRNGVATVFQGYRMRIGGHSFIVDASITDGYEGLVSFHLNPEEQTSLHHTGTLGNMDGTNALQWILLIIGVLAWAFTLWMAVDCCRREIHRKPLWLVLVLMGAVMFTLSIAGGHVNFRFNFGLFLNLSSLIRYGDGSMLLRLLVPVGAIVYFFRRKQLPPPPEKEAPAPEVEEVPTPDPEVEETD